MCGCCRYCYCMCSQLCLPGQVAHLGCFSTSWRTLVATNLVATNLVATNLVGVVVVVYVFSLVFVFKATLDLPVQGHLPVATNLACVCVCVCVCGCLRDELSMCVCDWLCIVDVVSACVYMHEYWRSVSVCVCVLMHIARHSVCTCFNLHACMHACIYVLNSYCTIGFSIRYIATKCQEKTSTT